VRGPNGANGNELVPTRDFLLRGASGGQFAYKPEAQAKGGTFACASGLYANRPSCEREIPSLQRVPAYALLF
jgi:hypothetical protein